jgi:hypothetical protein
MACDICVPLRRNDNGNRMNMIATPARGRQSSPEGLDSSPGRVLAGTTHGIEAKAAMAAPPGSDLGLSVLAGHYAGLSLPGRGHTLARWAVLAAIAARDVVAVKLFEAHADGIAILADLDAGGEISRVAAQQAGGTPIWGVWAAQPPDARVTGKADAAGVLRLDGRKAWCSGAAQMTHALLTYFNERGEAALAAVFLQEPGVRITGEGWHAVGMAATHSVDVCFDGVRAAPVGVPGAYIDRPGFWHGGAGIAACWYGAMLPFAQALADKMAARPEPHGMAHLGRIDVLLQQTRALLREAARDIDAHPQADARASALRVRAAVEATALQVMESAAKALGAAPLCRDAALARRFADLPVFLRQSHAERDLADLGACAAQYSRAADAWTL